MKRAVHAVGLWWIFWPLVGLYAAFAVMPATLWFQPGTQVVYAAKGAQPVVTQERAIHFDFLGEYHVIVRRAIDLTPVCEGSGGPFTYRKNPGTTPARMSLQDWAGGRCESLSPGEYVMETCWTVLRPVWGLLPPKRTCVDSNVFEVGE